MLLTVRRITCCVRYERRDDNTPDHPGSTNCGILAWPPYLPPTTSESSEGPLWLGVPTASHFDLGTTKIPAMRAIQISCEQGSTSFPCLGENGPGNRPRRLRSLRWPIKRANVRCGENPLEQLRISLISRNTKINSPGGYPLIRARRVTGWTQSLIKRIVYETTWHLWHIWAMILKIEKD